MTGTLEATPGPAKLTKRGHLRGGRPQEGLFGDVDGAKWQVTECRGALTSLSNRLEGPKEGLSDDAGGARAGR